VDPVDDDVDVRVFGIPVGDEEGLVLGEAELVKHPVGRLLHFLPGRLVAGIPGE